MFPTINKKETGVNLRRIMDMRGVKPKDIQEYLGFGCVQSVYRWLDGVSMPINENVVGCHEAEKSYWLHLYNNAILPKPKAINRKKLVALA